MTTVAVLFARTRSIYKQIPGCDVYDIRRDALTFKGGAPVVAHPPCRAWGTLSHLEKPRPGEKDLAPWAVDTVRENGGVLEHPWRSKLWPYCGLPEVGEVDQYGGFTLPIYQHDFGHRAQKMTRLYIVGCDRRAVPTWPLNLNDPTHVVSQSGRNRDGTRRARKRPECTKAEREKTPAALAQWLVSVARVCESGERVKAA